MGYHLASAVSGHIAPQYQPGGGREQQRRVPAEHGGCDGRGEGAGRRRGGQDGGGAADQPLGLVRDQGVQDELLGEQHPADGADDGGDGDAGDLGGDQGAAAGGGEQGRDDRLVPVLAAGGGDAQHEHGHAANHADLEHLVGAGRGAQRRGAVLARRGCGGDNADHGEADRQGQGDEEGARGGELAELGAGEADDGSHDGQTSKARLFARSLVRSKNRSSRLSVWRDSSSTMTLAAAAMRATRSGSAPRISTVPGATSRAVMCWRASTAMSSSVSGVRILVVLVAAASSATGPWAASRPRAITTTSSTVWAASASRWLETSTVRPWPASWRSRSRIQRIPSGSRPLSGSSRMSTPGSPSRVVARVSRWRMPREKVPTRRRAAPARPTRSKTSAARWRGIPAAVAMILRCSMALRPGWKESASRAAPTVRAGSGRSR